MQVTQPFEKPSNTPTPYIHASSTLIPNPNLTPVQLQRRAQTMHTPSRTPEFHPLMLAVKEQLLPPSPFPHHILSSICKPEAQNNHTYQNRKITAAKNPNQTLHPTPVFSAILNIRFIVPFNFNRLFSNESFIESANFEESRISSPMRCESYKSYRFISNRIPRRHSVSDRYMNVMV